MATTLASGSDFRSLSRQPPSDPDIQTTLSDFLNYTEHLPSGLQRTLTLLRDQRARAERNIAAIHEKTTLYSNLPNIKEERPDPVKLRRDISYALEDAERSCRMAVVEAARLHDTCERESKRLELVTSRLKSQPMPPSRDPTPEVQQALTSPNLKRERGISTRADHHVTTEKATRHLDGKAATKLRGRKIMVPGEVLPPPDPNAPPESITSWDSPRQSPPLEEPPTGEKDKKVTPRPRSRTPKPPKVDKEKEKKEKSNKPRAPRPAGGPGTNAHSVVAGISTSNALLALKEPPADSVKGSRWKPWMKLTEWEMAKLRKRMKKNAIWKPSATMVRRELKTLGRGNSGKEAARTAAEAGGEPFVDEHNENDPTMVTVTGEDNAQMNAFLGPQVIADDDDADAELINRGMRLNEAKKLKKQRQVEEAALQAQIAREQGMDPAVTDAKAVPSSPEASKKRKRDTTPVNTAAIVGADATDAPPKSAPTVKKLKLSAPVTVASTTSKVPLAPAGVSSSPRAGTSRSRRTATPPPARRPQLVLKARSKAVSEEPPNRRESFRRGSITSLPIVGAVVTATPTSAIKPAGGANTGRQQRKKRPAPGILTSADDESAKVGVSERKAAPTKRSSKSSGGASADAAAATAVEAVEDEIDPDEPRYCVCGDVSWGTMIACDNEDCEKEWFHLSCVGLSELPPRRTKWYCPDCRKKLKLGQASNGLVGRAQGR
nr:inhibitor of growth protein 3 [Quercus suber]